VAKNANADNDYWEEYKLLGKGFRGDPEEIEDMVVGNEDNPRALRKRKFDTDKFSHGE